MNSKTFHINKVINELKIFKMIISLFLLAVSVTISIPIYCVPVSESEHNLTVCIADGCIQGKVDESFEAFIGIPFAEPPLGNLRFAVS